MECEICGNRVTTKARIEGAILNVCSSCVKFGKEIRAQPDIKNIIGIIKPQKVIEQAINPDFAAIIKEAREEKKLTREQLANKINEKVSVIERVERDMKPDVKLRKKLENALNIDLSYEEEKVQVKLQKNEDYTLGDAVQIRIRKKSK